MASTPVTNETESKLRSLSLEDDTRNFHELTGRKNSGSLSNSASNSDTSLQELYSSSEFTFENVIGHLEDMLIDENFQMVQNSFLEKYWEEFDESEENKHSYMTIFNEYTNKIEDFITTYLKKRIKNFEMDVFASELEKKKNNLEGEIFEVLLTLTDFTAFKEIFLDFRAMKEGRTIDLGESLSVSSVAL